MIEDILIKETVLAIEKLYGQKIEPGLVQVQKTRKEFEGDLTVVVFPFTRISRKSPEQTATEIGNYLSVNIAEINRFSVVKGFLNIVISEKYWIDFLNKNASEKNFGVKSKSADRPWIIEFSSPNTNKPLHLGHIRNNLLGWSVSRLLEANGKNVVRVNLVNDRGIHICKSMLAWSKWGNGETPETTGLKGDKLVGKYYVLFEEKLKEEVIDLLNSAIQIICQELIVNNFDYKGIQEKLTGICFPDTPQDKLYLTQLVSEELERLKQEKSSGEETISIPYEYQKQFIEELKKKSQLLKEAQDLLLKWEAGDKPTLDLWNTMNKWVYAGFDVTYQNLGISFDKTYYESKTYLLGKEIVEDGLAKGVLFKKDDGSIWADLSDEGLDEKLLIRSDGTSVYMTQDLGTAKLRYEEYNPSKLIYVVGNEQNYHFNVLKKVLAKLGYSWAEIIHHLSYGMVELPEGKMKSREGTIVDADDLMNEMYTTAKQMTTELGKASEFSEDEADKLFLMIGLGALKYFILKVDPEKNMLFDPKESIDFDGNTGPFIQYTHARIQSLLRKAGSLDYSCKTSASVSLQPEECDIIRLCHDFPQTLEQAANELSPALVANYIYELSRTFNTFYQKIPVLKEENEEILLFRLKLTAFTGLIIRKGMYLLGIDVPEKM
jgi:arginyl-tRNA synthetase